jgi:hypothetical protein
MSERQDWFVVTRFEVSLLFISKEAERGHSTRVRLARCSLDCGSAGRVVKGDILLLETK